MVLNDDEKRIRHLVKYFLNKEKSSMHWLRSFFSSLFKSVCNLFSFSMWYGVLTFLFIYCIAIMCYFILTYVGGGICELIEKIIDAVNWVRRNMLAKSHDVHVAAIDSLAALVDGTCAEFRSPSYTLRYWTARTSGNSLCKHLSWYESITLTRWFVAKPLSFFYINIGTMPGTMCQLTLTWDMCAGVTGTKAILDFMVKKGLWILVGLYITFPMIKFVFHLLFSLLRVLCNEMHFQLYKMQPRLKRMREGFVHFWQRCHIFHKKKRRLTSKDTDDEQDNNIP